MNNDSYEPANQPSEPAESPKTAQLLGYDASGQPLYGTPASIPKPASPRESLGTAFQAPDAGASTRANSNTSPTPQPVRRADSPRSDAVRQSVKDNHDQCVRDYPSLDLADTEYVIMTIPRHQIGIAAPAFGGALLICLILAGIISYPLIITELAVVDAPSIWIIALIGLLLSVLVAGFVYMSMWLYRSNKLILTNESLVRNVQVSLFSKDVRTVSLGDVGGVNYSQTGVVQAMLGYGTVHVNTRGNDNIYRMTYAINPRKHTMAIETAVEEFKERFGVDHRF